MTVVTQIVGGMLSVITFLVGCVLWFISYLHRDMKKSIDAILLDLKPLITKVAIHDERITKLEEAHKEVAIKFGAIDKEMQHLMRSAQFKPR